MDKLLSYTFYPVFKNVFDHLDLETLVSCHNVSEEFRKMTINRFKTLQVNDEETWLKLFKIEKRSNYEYDLTNFRRENYPKEFIDTFKEQIIKFDYLVELVDYTTLTEEFLERNIKHVCLIKASIHTKLSESFIEKYKDKVDWEMICKYQNLSIDFIKRHADKVSWTMLIDYNKIPTEHFQSIMYQYKEEIEKEEWYWYLKYDIEGYWPSDYYDYYQNKS